MTRAASVVPSCNTGLQRSEIPTDGEAVCIDFLSLSADAVCFLRNSLPDQAAQLEGCMARPELLDVWASSVLRYLFGGAIATDGEVRGFRHFYDNHLRLRVTGTEIECGWIACGGERQRGTFAIQLTGAGCAHVMEWAELAAKLQSADAKLTRVDIAYDDFYGVHNLAECLKLHMAGAFDVRGQRPVIGHQGWDDGSGETLYVGKNAGSQQLCVYEKGKQLGDQQSQWVRWEGRLGAKYRPIAFDVLRDPIAYLRGHFPAMTWIEAMGKRMRAHLERAAATLKKSLRWFEHQYGGLVEYLHRGTRTAEQFGLLMRTFGKSRLPKWARDLPHGHETRPASVRTVSAAFAAQKETAP